MKVFLAAVVLAASSLTSLAQEAYLILKRAERVTTKDGVMLWLRENDCVPYTGKSDSGAWVGFNVGGIRGGVPWHDATVIAASPQAKANYKVVYERVGREYESVVAQRLAKQQQEARAAAAAAAYAASPEKRIDDLERRLAASERAADAAEADRQQEAQIAAWRARINAATADTERRNEQQKQQQQLDELQRKLRNGR